MGNLISGLTFTLFCATIAHEWAYFLSVGRHFQALLEPTDYLVSSIYWLPLLAIGIVIGAVKDFAVLRADNFRSVDDLISASPNPRIARLIHRGPYWFMGVFLVIASIGQLVLKNPYELVFAGWAAAYCWTGIVLWILKHPFVDERLGRNVGTLILVLPSFLFIATSHGLVAGYSDLNGPPQLYSIKKLDSSETLHLAPLRFIGKGIIARNPVDQQVVFLPWGKIEQIESTIDVDKRGMACRAFQKWC